MIRNHDVRSDRLSPTMTLRALRRLQVRPSDIVPPRRWTLKRVQGDEDKKVRPSPLLAASYLPGSRDDARG